MNGIWGMGDARESGVGCAVDHDGRGCAERRLA